MKMLLSINGTCWQWYASLFWIWPSYSSIGLKEYTKDNYLKNYLKNACNIIINFLAVWWSFFFHQWFLRLFCSAHLLLSCISKSSTDDIAWHSEQNYMPHEGYRLLLTKCLTKCWKLIHLQGWCVRELQCVFFSWDMENQQLSQR
jgi:hypothetical protein